jgi:hypothetical protein
MSCPGEVIPPVATAGGNRGVSPRRDSPGYNPLKAKTRVRIPLMGATTHHHLVVVTVERLGAA